jgi:DNA repair exonuclease SbcCD ATPase subunit
VKKLPDGEDPEDSIAPERDMDIDGDFPDSLFDDATWDSRFESLKRRVTMQSMLISALLAAILLIGYLDLRYRVSQIQATGSKKVQTLSEDIVQKIESLSYQYQTLDASLTKGLAALEKSSTLIKERLAKDQEAIENLSASSEMEKKTSSLLQQGVASHKDALDKLEKQLGGRLDEDANILTALQNDLMGQKKETARLLETMETIENLSQGQESAIKDLLESKADKEALNRSLDEERASYEERLSRLDKEISSIEDHLSRLERDVNMIRTSIEGHEAQSPNPPSGPDASAPNRAAAPAREKIEEQNIGE